MSDQNRYVAIVKNGEDAARTFVIDGTMTVDSLFELIDSKPASWSRMAGHGVTAIALHRDETNIPDFLDSLTQQMTPEERKSII